jgi:DNA-binding SARP family transcriptional activator
LRIGIGRSDGYGSGRITGVTEVVRICVLGPLEVSRADGEPVEIAGPRLRRLLIRLALEPGRAVTRDQLIAAVWDGEPPDGAGNA